MKGQRSDVGKEVALGYNRAMVGLVEIGSLIDRDQVIQAGRPKIAGFAS